MTPCTRLALTAALALATTAAVAAPDAKVLAAATAAQPQVVDTLEGLVLIESGSTDLDGLAKIATLIDDRLKALGFKTERRKAMPGLGADIVIGTLAGGLRAASCTVAPRFRARRCGSTSPSRLRARSRRARRSGSHGRCGRAPTRS